ncbi:MAG: hypothetical protein WBG86_14430, partial [Polyangiales bacterium]
MAFYEATQNISLVASEALTVSRFVDVTSGGEAAIATVAADDSIGICAETVASGVVAPVAFSGVGM